MRRHPVFVMVLLLLGAAWGLTQPLGKIAVTGGIQPVGILFWQLLIGAVILSAVARRGRRPLPRDGRQWALAALIAVIGTLLPQAASYTAIGHLPAGIVSMITALVPILALPMAVAAGLERATARRLTGLVLGLLGAALVALPGAGLPGGAARMWLLIAALAPAFYALEGTLVARIGTAGLDAIALVAGASAIGAVIALPIGLSMGVIPGVADLWSGAGAALVAMSVMHAVVYAGYLWLIGRAGSVFAAQVAYVVMIAGVFWSMLILGERYSALVWAALVAILAGLALVRPARRDGACDTAPAGT